MLLEFSLSLLQKYPALFQKLLYLKPISNLESTYRKHDKRRSKDCFLGKYSGVESEEATIALLLETNNNLKKYL